MRSIGKVGSQIYKMSDIESSAECAASNVRSNTFGIKPMNYHDAKVLRSVCLV
jgi:hypothetical protein